MTDNTFQQTDGSNKDSLQTDEQGNKTVEEQLQIVQKRLNDGLEFIDTLKKENKEYREQVQSLKGQEDKINQLLTRMDTSQQDSSEKTTQLDINDLRSQGFLTKDDLATEKLEAIKQQNFLEVQNALIEAYGKDKYLEVIQERSSILGMSVKDVDTLAQSNPKAVLKLFGQEKNTSSTPNSTTGSVNTQAFDKTNSSQPAKIETVMYGATSAEQLQSWKQAGEAAKIILEGNN